MIKDNGGEAIAVLAVSSKAEENKKLVEAVVTQYGRLDIACNSTLIIFLYISS